MHPSYNCVRNVTLVLKLLCNRFRVLPITNELLLVLGLKTSFFLIFFFILPVFAYILSERVITPAVGASSSSSSSLADP